MLRRAILFLLTAACFGESYRSGPQVLTFLSVVDDSDQPYALYLPRQLDSAKKYPLVISLHAADSNHRLDLRRVFGKGNRLGETDAEATRYFPLLRDVDFIVACPYARGTMGYQGIGEKDVYDVLADVKRRFRIDEDRIFLTGVSMGGGGALRLGLTRPDVWAAIAAVCPEVTPDVEDLALNALNVPVHLFHGDQDPLVPVEVSRKWHKMLLNLGGLVDYVEYPRVRHNAWDYAYKNGEIFDWFEKFRRQRYPERVRFVSRAYRYNTAYWVQLDGLTPGTPASIDARFLGENKLEITTGNVDGFTLKLAGHPQWTAMSPVSLTVDRATLRGKAAESVSLVRTEKGWRVGHYEPAAGNKRPRAEGPISEAVASRHIYIYGTADSPGEEELNRRRQLAAHAAEWSSPHSRLSLSLTVKADKDVTVRDLDEANLVLFGTNETNRLIARFSNQLPVALNAGAADYGLIFVAPEGNHYVVINSGLPWWTGADEARRPGLRFVPPAFRVLLTFGDYVLFKGGLESIVAEGRFDRQWKVPPDVASKMKETGTVVIQ